MPADTAPLAAAVTWRHRLRELVHTGDTTLSLRKAAIILMIVSSFMMSFGGLILRNMEAADAWHINLYRSLALCAGVFIILTFQYRRRAIAHIRKIGRPGLAGGALLAVANIAFLQSLTHTSVANTLFVVSAIPFFAAALARIFLGERLRRSTLIAMLVAAIGIVVMVAGGLGSGSGYGNAMALITAFAFATYAVIVRGKRRTDMLPTLLVSGAIIAAIAFVVRIDDLPIPLHDLLLCVLWGGLLSGLANSMFVIAMRHLGAAEVTLIMMLEFALGPLWVWIFVAEVPSRWTLVGGALVLGAVTVRALIDLRRDPSAHHLGANPLE